MSAPETYNEVMAWFGTGHKARLYDLHGLNMLLDAAAITSPEQIWLYVLEHRLLIVDSQEFWVTPKGKVWNVDWAMHEFLVIYPMEEMNVAAVESAGWLRVSKGNALCCTKPTRIQLDTLAVLRPDLQIRSPYGDVKPRKRYPYAERFDVKPPKNPWTVWVPSVDARRE